MHYFFIAYGAVFDRSRGDLGPVFRIKRQWFDETSGVGGRVRGARVLIVDEVDDSRKTLEYCVRELQLTNAPSAIAVAVVHNKLKKKKGTLRG